VNLRLTRVTEYNGATMGALCFNDKPEMLTLEEAWRKNERKVSCIPDGKYKIQRRKSPKFGITFEVLNVPNRSEIIFHIGNTAKDTEGCILVGQRYGYLHNDPAILNSNKAWQTFLKIMSGIDDAELTIISAYQTGGIQ
jgi:Family of unknown function (DUF5675)